MKTLCELAAQYATDKFGNYSRLYDWLFSAKRAQVRKVLEVGIGTKASMGHVKGYEPGASLRMWAEYFPNAQIVGFDKQIELRSEGRIVTMQVDQAKPNELVEAASLFGQFDLIVDDGSHIPAHQISSLFALFPFLSTSGMYVIEDVNDANIAHEIPLEHALFSYNYGTKQAGKAIIIHAQAKERLIEPFLTEYEREQTKQAHEKCNDITQNVTKGYTLTINDGDAIWVVNAAQQPRILWSK